MASTSTQGANARASGASERLSPDERIQRALEILRSGRLSVLDFMIKILDPQEPTYATHRDRLYAIPKSQTTGKLVKLLDLIYDDKRGREQITRWMEPHAVELMAKKVYQEMDTVKVSLRQPIDSVTPELLRNWDLNSMMDSVVKDRSPILHRTLQAASQTQTAEDNNKFKTSHTVGSCLTVTSTQCDILDSLKVCNVIVTQLAKQRSQQCSFFAIPFTLFVWTNGASRLTIEALYQCGLCISFTSLTKLLNKLATCCVENAICAAFNPHILCYDNINISTSIHVEQRSSAPAKVQSGTFAILYEIPNPNPLHTQLSPMLQRALNASDLTFYADICESG
jgi:hypothetical protein